MPTAIVPVSPSRLQLQTQLTQTTDDPLRREKDRATRQVENDHLARTIAKRIADSEKTKRAPAAEHSSATRNCVLLERAATFLGELLIDNRLDADQIVDATALHDSLMAATKPNPAIDPTYQHFADQVHATIDAIDPNKKLPNRSVGVGGDYRRHTGSTVRKLAWPVWVQGRCCNAVVTISYVTRRPRSHEYERFWYASLAEAKAAHPNAKLLDVPQVAATSATPA